MGATGAFIAGSIVSKLLLDNSQFKASVGEALKQGEKLSPMSARVASGFRTAGYAMTAIGGAAILALGKCLKATEGQVKAESQLNSVLASTVGVAGMTRKAVLDLSEALMQQSVYDHTAVLEAENLLLTFTSIGKEVFPEATKTVLDMSTALGQDLKSSSIQLGKALQDPIRGVTALRRVGVNFTEEQIKMIKTLVETSDKLGAQKLILKELATEFGGSALNATKNWSGQMKMLKNQLQDVQEDIGMALIPVIENLIPKIRGIAENISTWIKENKGLVTQIGEVVIKGAALFVVLGPILIILPQLVAGFDLLFGAITLSTGGLGLIAGAAFVAYLKINELTNAQNALAEAEIRESNQTKILNDKLREVAVAAGISMVEFNKLKDSYDGNIVTLTMAIKRGKEGVELQKALAAVSAEHKKVIDDLKTAQEAARKAQEEKTKAEKAALNLGFANKLSVQFAGLDAQYRAGKISLTDYETKSSELNTKLKELTGETDNTLTKTKEFIEFMKSQGIVTLVEKSRKVDELKGHLVQLGEEYKKGRISEGDYKDATWNTNEEIKKLNTTIVSTAVPAHRELGGVLSQLPSKLDDVAYSGKMTSYWFGVLCESMKTTKATGWLFTAELIRMSAAWKGIRLPEIMPPTDKDKTIAPIKSIWQEISTIVADACKNIAKSIIDAFGLHKMLTYQAKEFDDSYYENLKGLAEKTYDTSKKLIQDQIDILKDACSKEIDAIRSKYDQAKEAADKYYDGLKKEAQKNSEALEQYFKKYYDGLIQNINRAFDLQEIRSSREAENEERKYSRQYEDQNRIFAGRFEREKKAIENSKMTEKEKQAAISALERAYENEKIARERAYEDAKVKRERQRENEKIQREIKKENQIIQLQEQARQKEYQLQIQLQNRLEQLSIQKENREKQLMLQKEARELAAETRREIAEKALQDRLLALQVAHDAQVEVLRKAEDVARDKHAKDEEARQNSLWNKVKGIFATVVEEIATIWLTRLIGQIIPSFDKIGSKAEETLGEGGLIKTVKTATGGIGGIITGLATSIGTVLTTLATAIGAAVVTIATAIGAGIVALATAIATSVTILAAAVPGLLAIGLAAAAIYTAFKLGEGLVGAITGLFGKQKNTDITYWLKPISERAQEIRDWLFINGAFWFKALYDVLAEFKVFFCTAVAQDINHLRTVLPVQLFNIFNLINARETAQNRILSMIQTILEESLKFAAKLYSKLSSENTIAVRDKALLKESAKGFKGINKPISGPIPGFGIPNRPISGPIPFSPLNRPISGPIPGRTIGFDQPYRPISGPLPGPGPKPKPKPGPGIDDDITWLKRIHGRLAVISDILLRALEPKGLGGLERPGAPLSPLFAGPGRERSGVNVAITFDIRAHDRNDVARFIEQEAKPSLKKVIQRMLQGRELTVPAGAVGK